MLKAADLWPDNYRQICIIDFVFDKRCNFRCDLFQIAILRQYFGFFLITVLALSVVFPS